MYNEVIYSMSRVEYFDTLKGIFKIQKKIRCKKTTMWSIWKQLWQLYLQMTEDSNYFYQISIQRTKLFLAYV